MRFEHEFTVAVPLEQAWRALAGAEAVAASLPDAELRAVDGVHTGRIQLDPSRNLSCDATITAVDADEDEHVTTVSIHGRQVEGPAIGSAILRSRLSEQGSSTNVSLTAEVLTTGHAPGNGFEAGARRVFEAVAQGLERQARERPQTAPPPIAAPASDQAPAPAWAPGEVAEGPPPGRPSDPRRLAGAAAGLLIAAALVRRARRRRRRKS
jgi:carbon monoxide dehydrogenase subunit G